MRTSAFDIQDHEGNPVPFIIRTDVPRDAVRRIMDEVVGIFEAKGYAAGEFAWRRKLTALVIVEPAECRGQVDAVDQLPFGLGSRLSSVIDTWYPFWEIVPPENLKRIREMHAEWRKLADGMRDELRKRSVQEEEGIMLRKTDVWQDLDETNVLLSSIQDHAARMGAEFVTVLQPTDSDMPRVAKALEHMTRLELEVERAQMILRRIGRYGKYQGAPA